MKQLHQELLFGQRVTLVTQLHSKGGFKTVYSYRFMVYGVHTATSFQ